MKNYILGSVLITFFLFSCGPRVVTNLAHRYETLDYKAKVVILDLDEAIPSEAEELGEIKLGDTGFSIKCSYDVVIERLKFEARKVGGNALKITAHKSPSLASSCHRITAKILRISNVDTYENDEQEPFIEGADYAVLNVYRYPGFGSLIGYNLYLNDSIICRVKNNFKRTIQIKESGQDTIWAKTESKKSIPITIEKGKSYFLRCGIEMGFFVGKPTLELVDYKTGKKEFKSFKAKNK